MFDETLVNELRNSIESANTSLFFNLIDRIESGELNAIHCSGPISEAIAAAPTLKALAGIYPEIARFVRKAFDNGEITQESLFHLALEAISIIHADSYSSGCVGTDDPYFVGHNRKFFEFWRWFLAHLPADLKAPAFGRYEWHEVFVLPSIVISNPYDLSFYKEFCLDFEKRSPAWYAEISIEPEILEAIVSKAIALDKGEKVPPRAVPINMVKNNFFIADFLR